MEPFRVRVIEGIFIPVSQEQRDRDQREYETMLARIRELNAANNPDAVEIACAEFRARNGLKR